MIFFDTETTGLTGPALLIQYAEDDGPVVLHEVFHTPVYKTLELIERLCDATVCAFNISFDWFHINKLYNLLVHVKDKNQSPGLEEMADISRKKHSEITRFCLKPKGVLDLFLYSRKTEWQNLMGRRNIVIRHIPNQVIHKVAALITNKLKIPEIFFTKSDRGYHWDIETEEDARDFSKLTLRFKASGGLKALATELLKVKAFDLPIPKDMFPQEHSYNPYYVGWEKKIYGLINYWHSNMDARSYAEQDVILLQRLFRYWDSPEPNDIDSILACCVGAARWKGYAVSVHSMITRLTWLQLMIDKCPINTSNHTDCKEYLWEVASIHEKVMIKNTEDKTLQALMENNDGMVCGRAREIQSVRKYSKEADNLRKLIATGSFNPDFKVIGTKSGRMSGGSAEGISGGSINPQGIQHEDRFRNMFSLAYPDEFLSGGDFESFEISILQGVTGDEQLGLDLEQGKKFHAQFGSLLFDLPVEDIESTKGSANDLYLKAKIGGLAVIYGAESYTVANTAGVSGSQATTAIESLSERYPKYGSFRDSITESLRAMHQPGGLGTPIFWQQPVSFVESFLGFRRYFTLENMVSRQLYELAAHLPLSASFASGETVLRKKRQQSIKGAVQTALFAAAFKVRAQVVRAGFNHYISSPGAYITKAVQGAVWDIQPAGIHEWYVRPFNVHDEVMVAHQPGLEEVIEQVVEKTVASFKDKVPHIKMVWKKNMANWSEK